MKTKPQTFRTVRDARAEKLQADAIDAEARRVERMAELLVQCREALSKSIEFVPTGYGIERQCWEALAALDEFEKGTR